MAWSDWTTAAPASLLAPGLNARRTSTRLIIGADLFKSIARAVKNGAAHVNAAHIQSGALHWDKAPVGAWDGRGGFVAARLQTQRSSVANPTLFISGGFGLSSTSRRNTSGRA